MAKTNLTYVLCNIGGIAQYLWIADVIDKDVFNLSFVFLDETTNVLKASLVDKGFSCYQLNVRSKKDIPKAIIQTIKIFRKEKTSIVHTHLVDASLVGLTAAKIIGIKKRIHTRHHSNFHHEHYKKGVVLDNLINYLSTDIIVISKEVQSILEKKEKFHLKKIKLIYHGFKLEEFNNVPEETVTAIRLKYSLKGFPVIGMVSRYEKGKGIEYCFHAFEKLLQEYPDAILVIANAFGSDIVSVSQFLKKLPPQNLREIEFEKEIKALYKCFNLFVHVPVDPLYEAFGQVYIEAMAASVPGIYTLSGIASEYVENNKNAIVVDYKNDEQIYSAMIRYLSDTAFTEKVIKIAKEDVSATFGFDKMMSELNALYLG